MVMHRVYVLVERRHVDEPVDAVEMHLVIDRQHKREHCKPDRWAVKVVQGPQPLAAAWRIRTS